MVVLSKPQRQPHAPSGSTSGVGSPTKSAPPAYRHLHTHHAIPTPPPSPPLSSSQSSSSAHLDDHEYADDPPDLLPLSPAPSSSSTLNVDLLPPPLLPCLPPPARPAPPTLVQLATSLPTLPPETFQSRRRLLHLTTTLGRSLHAAVVTWDDPVGGTLVCAVWLAVCAGAWHLIVFGPHVAALGVLVGNYPATLAVRQPGAVGSSASPRKPRARTAEWTPLPPPPPPPPPAGRGGGDPLAWSTTLSDLSSLSRTLSRARSLAATPLALAAWTDPDRSLTALWAVLATLPLWVGLNLTLPMHHAVGVAGLAPLCVGLMPKVLATLPQPLHGAKVPGSWNEEKAKVWIGFGVGVYVTRYRVWRLGQGYGALLADEGMRVEGGGGQAWRSRHLVSLPAEGTLGVRSGWLQRMAGGCGAKRFVSGVRARMQQGEAGGDAGLDVKWEWEQEEAADHGDGWEAVGEWEGVEVPEQGILGRIMARVERRRYVRQAVCWVHVPVHRHTRREE